jgi:hypothetical protein
LLKDVYAFYKRSPKRKGQLNGTITREDQLFNAFFEAMECAIADGERELSEIPTLRLLKWNATRWLGRAGCLDALTKAYEYVIEHLYQFSQSEKIKANRDTAADLYQRLISYDNFLFIFLYRDLTEQLAITSKWLQEKKLMIRDVGRRILNLNERLISSYPAGSVVPVPLINIGKADTVLRDLFGEDLSCKSKHL